MDYDVKEGKMAVRQLEEAIEWGLTLVVVLIAFFMGVKLVEIIYGNS